MAGSPPTKAETDLSHVVQGIIAIKNNLPTSDPTRLKLEALLKSKADDFPLGTACLCYFDGGMEVVLPSAVCTMNGGTCV